jgi:ADP-dependent NAD(P)H-hydrate dehydratase / NAD(P)H-hydrate epimerase
LYLVTAEEMRRIEERIMEETGLPGTVLMENAGRSVADEITKRFPKPQKAVILAGKGNNGGDGWVIARYLLYRNWDVACWLVGNPDQLTPDAKVFYHVLQSFTPIQTYHSGRLDALKSDLSQAGVIVDALLGTGVNGSLRPPVKEVVGQINASGKWVVSVDLPTGLHTDGASIDSEKVKADLTVTFQYPKWGHFSRQGKALSGKLVIKEIGLPPELKAELKPKGRLNDPVWWKNSWSPRDPWSHKGSHGHLLLIGGSKGMLGAICMAGEAAYRMGAGYVTLAVPESERHALAAKVTQPLIWPWPGEGTFHPDSADGLREKAGQISAMAIGPGLGRFEGEDKWLRDVLSTMQGPLVLDADALNILAAYPDLLGDLRQRKVPAIITPHPGEMARLTSLSVKEVEAGRVDVARSYAKRSGMIVVLKGRFTLIAHPDGTVILNPTGSPALAKAGSGDVLTGMIGSLLAQKVSPFEAAAMAVYLHGKAAGLSGTHSHSMVYTDLLDGIQRAVRQEFVE